MNHPWRWRIMRRIGFLFAPIACSFAPAVFAFPVTYIYTGHATSVSEGLPFFSVDNPFSGSITIESTTPVRYHQSWTQYASKPAFTLTVGNQTWSKTANSGERCDFDVSNGAIDQIDFFCGADAGTPIGNMNGWWRFIDQTGTAFSDYSLPLGPFLPNAFHSGFVAINFFYWGDLGLTLGSFRGVPDSLSVSFVSEPNVNSILATGIICMLLLVWRPINNFRKSRELGTMSRRKFSPGVPIFAVIRVAGFNTRPPTP
jgi:hypothetical protein